jgi:hypothetical protein
MYLCYELEVSLMNQETVISRNHVSTSGVRFYQKLGQYNKVCVIIFFGLLKNVETVEKCKNTNIVINRQFCV